MEGVDYITCKVCGAQRRTLANGHIRSHGMTNEEYKEKYHTDILTCTEFKSNCSESNKKWASENREKVIERGKKSQEGYRKWASENPELATLGRSLGGTKGAETQRNDPKYRVIWESNGKKLNEWKENNPDVSSSIYSENLNKWKKEHPEDVSHISSITAKETMKRRWSENYEEERKSAAANLMTWMNDPNNEKDVIESKRMSRRSQAKMISADINRFDILDVRSWLECRFLYHCDHSPKVITCEYESILIPYNDTHKYIPDFFINKYYIIEIKPLSRLLDEDTIVKKSAAEVYCSSHNYKYIIITQEDIDKINESSIDVIDYFEMKV